MSLALLVVVGLAATQRWQAVEGASVLPAAWAMVVAVLIYALANRVLAGAWHTTIRLAGSPMSATTARWVWSSSQLTRYTFGLAHVGGRAAMGRAHGLPAVAGALSTVVELGWLITSTSVLVLASAPFVLSASDPPLALLGLAVVPVAGVAVVIAAPQRILRAAAGLAARGPVARVMRGRLASLADVELERRDVASLAGRYALNSVLRLGAFVVLLSTTAPTLDGVVGPAIAAYAIGNLAGAVAVFAPGGLGVREATSALGLSPVIGGGPALGLVAAVRLLELAGELVLLVVSRVAFRRAVRSEAVPT